MSWEEVGPRYRWLGNVLREGWRQSNNIIVGGARHSNTCSAKVIMSSMEDDEVV